MPYLVDGDNLLGTWPGRERDDRERRRLARELDRWSARERRPSVVVFDGCDPGTAGAAGPSVMWAGPNRSADDAILGLLRQEADPRGWIVVTSDRSLGDRCRHLGARVERADAFRKRLQRQAGGPEKPEREDDVEFWLDQFGDEG